MSYYVTRIFKVSYLPFDEMTNSRINYFYKCQVFKVSLGLCSLYLLRCLSLKRERLLNTQTVRTQPTQQSSYVYLNCLILRVSQHFMKYLNKGTT